MSPANDNGRDRQLALELALRAALAAMLNAKPVLDRLASRKVCRSIDAAIAQAQALNTPQNDGPAAVVLPLPFGQPMNRREIMAATTLELRGRLARITDRMSWEANTIRAELHARSKVPS